MGWSGIGEVKVGETMNGEGGRRHGALGIDESLETAELRPIAEEANRPDFHDPVGFRHQPGRFEVESDIFPF